MKVRKPRLHADFPSDERDQRSHLAWMQLQCSGFTWRGVAVWDKTGGLRSQRGPFSNQAEHVVWGSKGDMPLDRAAPTLPGVFREPVRKADKHHLTGKPTDLMRPLVRICEEGGASTLVGGGARLRATTGPGSR